jgi:hypothetical protein
MKTNDNLDPSSVELGDCPLSRILLVPSMPVNDFSRNSFEFFYRGVHLDNLPLAADALLYHPSLRDFTEPPNRGAGDPL